MLHTKKILDVPKDLPASVVVATMAQTWEAAELLLASLEVKRDLFSYDEGGYLFTPKNAFGRPEFRVTYTKVGPYKFTTSLSLWHQPYPGALSPIDDTATNICVVADYQRRRPEVVRLCDDFARLMGALPKLGAIVQQWPQNALPLPGHYAA